MTHGHELMWGNAGWKGGAEQRGIKRKKIWDNCNSIISKIYLKKEDASLSYIFSVAERTDRNKLVLTSITVSTIKIKLKKISFLSFARCYWLEAHAQGEGLTQRRDSLGAMLGCVRLPLVEEKLKWSH